MTEQEKKELELLELENQNAIAVSQEQPAPADTTAVDSAVPTRSMSSSLDSNSTTAMKIQSLFGPRIDAAAQKYKVDPKALATVIHRESSGDSTARNPKSSATGLGQFIRSTAKSMGITDPTDASQSIDATARYLRKNLDKFGSYDKAMAAHHEGETAMQRAVDQSRAETGSDADFTRFISPEADTELRDFKRIYSNTYGGEDSSLYAIQEPTQQSYNLGITKSNGRYPINPEDQKLARYSDKDLRKVIAKNRAANALLAPDGQVIPESVYADAQNSGGTLANLGAGLGRFGYDVANVAKSPLRAAGLAAPISQQEKDDVIDYDRRAGTAQKVGAALPELAATALGGEYAVAKLGLRSLGGALGAKVASKVPGAISEKLAKFVGERVASGLGYVAPQMAVDNARAVSQGMPISTKDNIYSGLISAGIEVGTGGLGHTLKKLAPGTLTKALGLAPSDLTRPGALNPTTALEEGLVKSTMKGTVNSLEKDLNGPSGLSQKVQDMLFHDSRKIEPIPDFPIDPKRLPDGRGDFYNTVPNKQIGPTPGPVTPNSIENKGYTEVMRRADPRANPPSVIPITATRAQKAADQARILAENNTTREASVELARKAALDRKAAEVAYSNKVLQDKADALLQRPKSTVDAARAIPEKGLAPSDIPNTSLLSSKKKAAAEAERFRREGPIQASDDKLVNDALAKDDFLEYGKDKLKGQRGSLDVGALRQLAGKAVEGSRSLKDPFPTVKGAYSSVKDKADALLHKTKGTVKDKYVAPTHGNVPEGHRLVEDFKIDALKAVDDAESTLKEAYKQESGGQLKKKGHDEALKALQDTREDITSRETFDNFSKKNTAISAKGFLDRIDSELKKLYDFRAKNGITEATPTERALLETQVNLRKEMKSKVPKSTDLVTEQAKRMPLLLQAKKQVDKKFLQNASAYAVRGTVGGVTGGALGYYSGGGTAGAITGGILGGGLSKLAVSAAGAKAYQAIGKRLEKQGKLRSLAANVIIKTKEEERKDKIRKGVK